MALDPRAGHSMPCQVTVSAVGERVTLAPRNPQFPDLDHAGGGAGPCAVAPGLLLDLMQEAAQ